MLQHLETKKNKKKMVYIQSQNNINMMTSTTIRYTVSSAYRGDWGRLCSRCAGLRWRE